MWGDWMGVMHGDEIEYVFGHPLNQSLHHSQEEKNLASKMIQAFATFSKHGEPLVDDPDWPSYTRDHPFYYIFDAKMNGIGKGPRTTACAFWNEFLPRLKGIPDPSPAACNETTSASSISAGAWRLRVSLLNTIWCICVNLLLGPVLLVHSIVIG